MPGYWLKLVARLTLGILVILQGQANVIASALLPACSAGKCSKEAGAPDSCVNEQCCCCDCHEDDSQTPAPADEGNPSSRPAKADDAATLQHSYPCCPECPTCPAGCCVCCGLAKAPGVLAQDLFVLDLPCLEGLNADHRLSIPDANPDEIILPPRA